MSQQKIKLSLAIAGIAGAATLFVGLLLLLNFVQLQNSKPLESSAMEALSKRLESEPNNDELKQEIRSLDLLARKAFFTSKWQMQTGSYLLLFFAVVTIVALRFYFSQTHKIKLQEEKKETDLTTRMLSQKWILGTAALFFGLAVLAAFFSNKHYKEYSLAAVDEKKIATEDNEIQVLEITPKVDSVSQEKEEIQDTVVQQETVVEKKAEIDSTKKEDAKKETVKEVEKPKQPVYPSLSAIKKQHNTFRGPLGQGVSYHKNIPSDWDGASMKNIAWKIPQEKPGFNSPVIWGEKLFVSGGDNAERWVYCYNRNSGKQLWKQQVKDIPNAPNTAPKTTPDTGLAAPTLTTDGERVYAIFGTGNIIAFNMDGKRQWARHIEVPGNHYGHSSSLLSWKEKLFVQFDTKKGGRIMALNVLDGKTIWDKKRNSKISWASPIMAKINGSYQLLLNGLPNAAGYDINTGNEIWATNCMMGEVGPSLAYSDGYIVAANEYAKIAVISVADGYKIKWEGMDYMPEVASPAIAKGLLFISTSYGVMVCYDLVSGEMYWEQDWGEGIYATPMIVGNRLYQFDRTGKCHIVEVSKTFKEIATPSLGEEVVTTPAFMDGKIYVRGSKNLYCIGK